MKINANDAILNPDKVWRELDHALETLGSSNPVQAVRIGAIGFNVGALNVDFNRMAQFFTIASKALEQINYKNSPIRHLEAAFDVALMHADLNRTDVNMYPAVRKLIPEEHLQPKWS